MVRLHVWWWVVGSLAACTLTLLLGYCYGVISSEHGAYIRDTVITTESSEKASPEIDDFSQHSTVYVITPTHERWTRRPDMTRLRNTLAHIRNILWIVVEDGNSTHTPTAQWLEEQNASGLTGHVPYVYLCAQTQPLNNHTHKGLDQRNTALDYISHHNLTGVVYFADDDNAYDVAVFKHIRRVTSAATFTVGGLSVKAGYEGPIIQDGHVVGWETDYLRRYSVDMAGMAIHTSKLTTQRFKWEWNPGTMETYFLASVAHGKENLEVIPELTARVYVWHTQTKQDRKGRPLPHYPPHWHTPNSVNNTNNST